MKFSKRYAKLFWGTFTTIRKNMDYYKVGMVYRVEFPGKEYRAEVVSIRKIKKADISETIALRDADMSRKEIIGLLEKWYGPEFDDFILITLMAI